MELAPEQAGLSPERLERITSHLNKNYIEPGKIAGCQTLVARHGHVAYFQSLGRMDRERQRPMADDTIFRIYSMTKPITSVALMTLYEQGHFQLNDPVYKVIPEWRDHRVWVSGEGDAMETREPKTPMTFRHVLSHTGGLTYGMTRHPVDRAYARAGRAAQPAKRCGRSSRSWRTSRCATIPAMRGCTRFRRTSARTWSRRSPASASTRTCRRRCSTRSACATRRSKIAPEKVERFAANYQRAPDKTLKLVDDPQNSTYSRTPTFLSGGGGLTSTTADYFRFCEMLRRGGELDGARMLGPRTIELMAKNHLSGGRHLTQMAKGAFSETAYEGIGFGLGFATTHG